MIQSKLRDLQTVVGTEGHDGQTVTRMLLDPEAATVEGPHARGGGGGRRRRWKEVIHGDRECGERQEVNVGGDGMRGRTSGRMPA